MSLSFSALSKNHNFNKCYKANQVQFDHLNLSADNTLSSYANNR
jgi:hypothetical protein